LVYEEGKRRSAVERERAASSTQRKKIKPRSAQIHRKSG
jgi:hypothetical protein